MRDSEILKKVRTAIRCKRRSAICFAISDVCMEYRISYLQMFRLKRWVRGMLGYGNWYYEDWLSVNHPDVLCTMSRNDLRQGRLQWLDWMIAYCEKEEAR